MYEGLTKCEHCGARYKPGDWYSCYRLAPNDTSGAHGGFKVKIPDDECPLCRKPKAENDKGARLTS